MYNKYMDKDLTQHDFISTVSHELRTPLTSIRGFAQTMLSSWDVLDEDSKKQFLKIIEEQSNRLIKLVENILAVSKSQNSSNYVFKNVEPNSAIKNVIPVINSTLFYFIWKASSDGFNLPTKFSKDVLPHLLDNELNLISLYKKLIESMIIHSESHVRNQKTTGRTEIQLFRIKPVKPIVDEIDKVLAKHYGFTEEELDFIINYDIKYRMGDELDNNE